MRLPQSARTSPSLFEPLPDGYDTQVGQRFLADKSSAFPLRACSSRTPPLLILDEAISALDNELSVQFRTFELAKNRTTLVIAHRLSTIMGADEITTTPRSCKVERGTQYELARKQGTLITTKRSLAVRQPQGGKVEHKCFCETRFAACSLQPTARNQRLKVNASHALKACLCRLNE